MNGLEIRFNDFRETSASNAPGVTQLILFEYKDKVSRLTRPWNNFLLTLVILFSARILKPRGGNVINISL